jgi:hypothetical protein
VNSWHLREVPYNGMIVDPDEDLLLYKGHSWFIVLHEAYLYVGNPMREIEYEVRDKDDSSDWYKIYPPKTLSRDLRMKIDVLLLTRRFF